jgi:hypothetical protein
MGKPDKCVNRGRLCGRKNLPQRRGSDLDKDAVDSTITTIG